MRFRSRWLRGLGAGSTLAAAAALCVGGAALAAGGGGDMPKRLTLSPKTATNSVGDLHCVTATVTNHDGNPVSGVTVRFTVGGANSASGSQTTNGSGEATFCYTGTKAGTDVISAFADTNNNGTQQRGEPAGAAKKVWKKPPPPITIKSITLSPTSAKNPVGTQHCVTATVKDSSGAPAAGVSVVFQVSGANSANGSQTTNGSGQATFCYTGTNIGVDVITAFADANKNSIQDSGEPKAAAAKTWEKKRDDGSSKDDDSSKDGPSKDHDSKSKDDGSSKDDDSSKDGPSKDHDSKSKDGKSKDSKSKDGKSKDSKSKDSKSKDSKSKDSKSKDGKSKDKGKSKSPPKSKKK